MTAKYRLSWLLADYGCFDSPNHYRTQRTTIVRKAQNFYMGKKIKLIWDFRGPAAAKTAEHHEKHLREYIAIEETALNITGHHDINDMLSFAFMVVEESEMISVRDALKPHRGEVYEEK